MRDQASSFEEYWEISGSRYETAVIENGGTPWPLDPEKRAATAERLGLPDDTDPMELRRALWERRNKSRSNAASRPLLTGRLCGRAIVSNIFLIFT